MTPNRRQVLWAVLLLTAGFVVVALSTAAIVSATTATKIRQSQVSNTKTLDTTQHTLAIVQDCTQPKGECYERGQKQTADAVADLNRVSVLAAACADKRGVQGEDEIYACVVSALAKDHAEDH